MHPDIIVAIVGSILLLLSPMVYWLHSTKNSDEKKFSLWLLIEVIIADILILYIAFKNYGGF